MQFLAETRRMAEIDKTEVASRKEIPIAINLRGLSGTAGKVGAAVLVATVASPVMNRGASKKQFPVTSVPRSVAARGSVIFPFTF